MENNQNQMNMGSEVLPNASTALTLGILSLVFCGIVGLILGIIGLNKGKAAMAEFDANPGRYTQSSYNNAKAGKTCSLIGVILGSIGAVIALIYIILIAVVGAHL